MNHVAMLIPSIDRVGGAERQVLHLAMGLHLRGWRVTVIALSGNGGDAAVELSAAGIEYLSLAMRKGLMDPSGWLRLHRWIRNQQPEVLHAHLPHAAWMARWSRLFAPVRVVLDTIHTSACGTLGRQIGYRWSNSLPDAITAVSQGAARAWENARMVAAEKLFVIPNGVDTNQWRPALAERAALRRQLVLADDFVWLAAGRMEAVKNFRCLLDAIARASPPARLVIAGTGPMQAELHTRCAQLGLASRVRFLGFEKNLLPWMQAADAFVLPSLGEGLPMVLLEAGACALPTVATDVPGCRDVVVHGVTGLLASPRSPESLAESMNAIMRFSPDFRAALGRQARHHVKSQFDLDSVVVRWDGLYRHLLEQRRMASRWALTKQSRLVPGTITFHPQHDPPHCEPRVDSL